MAESVIPIIRKSSSGAERGARGPATTRRVAHHRPDVDLGLSHTTTLCPRDSHQPEPIMKYLCLIYEDESSWARCRAGNRRHDERVRRLHRDIKRSGHYLGGNALQPTQSASTVRVRKGKISTTAGPFAETKEQLGGYYLIEAKDLNDASRCRADSRGARRVDRGASHPGVQCG
jgi:hypothetical protein